MLATAVFLAFCHIGSAHIKKPVCPQDELYTSLSSHGHRMCVSLIGDGECTHTHLPTQLTNYPVATISSYVSTDSRVTHLKY